MILPDEKEDPVEFLEKSGWMEEADEQGIIFIVLNSSFSNYIPDINSRIVAYLARHQNRNCRIIPSPKRISTP